MNLPIDTPAKLVCVSSALVCNCRGCRMWPGFYKIVWSIPVKMQTDTKSLFELHRYPLFGKVICATPRVA